MEEEIQNTNHEGGEVAAHDLVVAIRNSDDHFDNLKTESATEVSGEISTTQATTPPASFAKIEKSLASLGFFTPSSRRVKNQQVKRIGFTREMNGKRVEVTAEVIPSSLFGLPITADQDKYLALQKIITNTMQSEGKIANPIRFKSAELLRLLNDSTKSGKNYKDISEWLDVMSSTTIISNGAVWVAGQKRFSRDRFRVFDRAVSVGKELDDGSVADANYVWLSSWQLENINNNFLLPIDLDTYRELKNHISKALVPLLQIWLFASHKVGFFEKRYNELCEILTLQTYRAPSLIRRQLKPSLDELTQYGYLEKWRIEKTSDRKAYKVIFFHGPKFHRDRRRRLEQKTQTESPVIVAESEPVEPSLPEPGKLQENSSATSATQIPDTTKVEESTEMGNLVDELASRGIMPSSAMKLLASIPTDRLGKVSDYVEYWDSQKKTSNIGAGLLYNLIRNGDPLPETFEPRKEREERRAADDRRQKFARLEKVIQSKFEDHCTLLVDSFVAESLPSGEYENRVAAYKTTMLSKPGFWSNRPEVAEQFARHAIRAEVAKEASLPTYEEFRRGVLPATLAQLNLNPTELGLETGGENAATTDIAQDALSGLPSAVHLKDETFVISDENSSSKPPQAPTEGVNNAIA